MASHAAVLKRTNGIRAHLPGQIDLQGAVDRRDFRILANDGRVIREGGLLENHHRVVVDEAIQAFAAERKRGHNFVRHHHLFLTRNDTGFDQRDEAVGEHLGVDAEPAVVAKLFQNSVGDGADAHLQGGPIVDETSHMAADGTLDICEGSLGRCRQWAVAQDGTIDFIPVQMAIAVRSGYVFVDFRNHDARGFNGRGGDVY